MTTAMDPDVDVWPFQDFDVPCDILRAITADRCPDPAGWHGRFTATCCGDRVSVLLCTAHKDYLLTGAVWWCPTAHRSYLPADINLTPL